MIKSPMTNVRKESGFTILELMVALTLFIVVMTMSMGSIVGIFDTNRKSNSLKSIMSNLNLAVESMSKEMRYGKNYHCSSSGTLSLPQNCPNGDNSMTFLSSDNEEITYRINGPTLEKRVGGGSFIPITAKDVVVNSFTFYVLGTGNGDTLQPKVIIKIKGYAGGPKGRSDFAIQTMVSQRALDL